MGFSREPINLIWRVLEHKDFCFRKHLEETNICPPENQGELGLTEKGSDQVSGGLGPVFLSWPQFPICEMEGVRE